MGIADSAIMEFAAGLDHASRIEEAWAGFWRGEEYLVHNMRLIGALYRIADSDPNISDAMEPMICRIEGAQSLMARYTEPAVIDALGEKQGEDAVSVALRTFSEWAGYERRELTREEEEHSFVVWNDMEDAERALEPPDKIGDYADESAFEECLQDSRMSLALALYGVVEREHKQLFALTEGDGVTREVWDRYFAHGLTMQKATSDLMAEMRRWRGDTVWTLNEVGLD